jgi:hypothetical protein
MRHSLQERTEIVGGPPDIETGFTIEINPSALCFDLMKVNFDGPTLRLTADFSVSESLLTQTCNWVEFTEKSQSKIQ